MRGDGGETNGVRPCLISRCRILSLVCLRVSSLQIINIKSWSFLHFFSRRVPQQKCNLPITNRISPRPKPPQRRHREEDIIQPPKPGILIQRLATFIPVISMPRANHNRIWIQPDQLLRELYHRRISRRDITRRQRPQIILNNVLRNSFTLDRDPSLHIF